MSIDRTKCNDCSNIFRIYNRKMTCENCDLIFCSKCRNFEIEIENKPKKVCSTCFHFLMDLQSKLQTNTTTNDELDILKRDILSNTNSIINTGITTTEVLVKQQEQTRNDLKKMENISENLTISDRLITKLSSGFGLFSKNEPPIKKYKLDTPEKTNTTNKIVTRNIDNKITEEQETNQNKDFYNELLDNITQIQDISKNQQTILKQHTEDLKELNKKVVDSNNRINHNTKKIKKIT